MSDTGTLLKNAKANGQKVVGLYCAYAPKELIMAAGALAFGLCATKEEAIPDGERVLPRSFCPLIKSSYGMAATDKCPFFLYADLIVGETTCDGKKKMFELMADFKKVHVMRLPSGNQGAAEHSYWLGEVEKLKQVLEAELGVKITEENLRVAIRTMNEERRLLQKLSALMQNDPVPVTGQDMLKLLWGRNFVLDPADFAEQLREIIADLEQKVSAGEGATAKGAKRIIVTGVPTGVGADKVNQIIEDCGAVVVYMDNCSGMKPYTELVDETKAPLAAIAAKYLDIPCSCMSPNPQRLEQYAALLQDYHADGVVDITWQGCHTYNAESRLLQRHLKALGDIPYLQIETDYSQSDTEQIRTRVQAFLELKD